MKKPIPLPTSGRKAAQGAIMLALTVLQDERVREQLRKAPAAAQEWAAARREPSEPGLADKLDPTQRFGHKAVERRIRALQRNVVLVFPDAAAGDGAAIHRAVAELQNATAISATMPLAERRRARRRIAAEVTRLETALVDAVLPPDR